MGILQIKAMTEDQWRQVLGGRRQLLAGAGLLLFSGFPGVSNALVAAKIDLSKTPSHHFDVDDQLLVQAATLFNKALSASTVLHPQFSILLSQAFFSLIEVLQIHILVRLDLFVT